MAAAVLTKVLRGGRRLGSSSHALLRPPRQGSGIARRAPQDGGGRRLGSSSHPLLLPPCQGSGIARQAPQDGGVGGRCLGSSSHALLLPPRQGSGIARRAPQDGGVGCHFLLRGIGRRASLVGGVGPLPPRFGGTAPASPSAGVPLQLHKARYICSKKQMDTNLSLIELSKFYIWIGYFEWYDSKFIPMYLWKITKDQDFNLKFYRKFWIPPISAFVVVSYMIIKFVIEYHQYQKLNKAEAKLRKDILEVQKETEGLIVKHLDLKKSLATRRT